MHTPTFEHEIFAEIIPSVSVYSTIYRLACGLSHGWTSPAFILPDFRREGGEDWAALGARAEAVVAAIRTPSEWASFADAVEERMAAEEAADAGISSPFGAGLRPTLSHESGTGRYRWHVEGVAGDAVVVVEIWRPTAVSDAPDFWGTRRVTAAACVARARVRDGRVVALTAAGGAENRHLGYLRDLLARVAVIPGAPVAPPRPTGGWDDSTAAEHAAHEAAMRAFGDACEAWAASVPRGDTYTIGRPVPVPQPEVRDYSDAVIHRPQEDGVEEWA